MSTIFDSSFKKPECGSIIGSGVAKDSLGGVVNLQIVGTDPDHSGPINGAALTVDYVPAEGNVGLGGIFLITIETDAATYNVVLADGTQFTITPTQSTAHLGQWYPARLLRVLEAGTTGSFSVGY